MNSTDLPTDNPPPAKPKLVLGALEIVAFPAFGWKDVSARVDTGAAISAIHCTKVRLSESGGVPSLNFYLQTQQGQKAKKFSTTRFKEKLIKNSSGQVERRYVITTQIALFGKKFTTEFSLANRSKMTYPVLLGRKLLRKRFVVDISLKKELKQLNQESK